MTCLNIIFCYMNAYFLTLVLNKQQKKILTNGTQQINCHYFKISHFTGHIFNNKYFVIALNHLAVTNTVCGFIYFLYIYLKL